MESVDGGGGQAGLDGVLAQGFLQKVLPALASPQTARFSRRCTDVPISRAARRMYGSRIRPQQPFQLGIQRQRARAGRGHGCSRSWPSSVAGRWLIWVSNAAVCLGRRWPSKRWWAWSLTLDENEHRHAVELEHRDDPALARI